MDYHCADITQVSKHYGVDIQKGLTRAQAAKRLEENGENRLKEKKNGNVILKFLAQLSDPMVITLIIAAVISFFTAYAEENGSYIDPIIIVGIVILNAIVGVVQEAKAEHAIEKLKELSAPDATVIRGGKQIKIPAAEVVAGDIILLSAGDRVPADARLIESVEISCDESALTGEALPSAKNAFIKLAKDTPVAERKNCVFASTTVLTGHGTAIVTATGMDTQIGKIADMLGREKSPRTPLQLRLEKISRVLGIGAVGICLLVFAMGMLRHDGLLASFMLAISLAVA
ncbi:MAG: HAD-IC family P-type ATPase, partial [Clostridia bacterium]|nr:HAD-IC family P-type ATPase [Clostridia bacterium]